MQTFGQKAVGLSFNPSGDDAVSKAKQIMADAIDQMKEFQDAPETPNGARRHAAVSITELETAQMRMVKALTWKD